MARSVPWFFHMGADLSSYAPPLQTTSSSGISNNAKGRHRRVRNRPKLLHLLIFFFHSEICQGHCHVCTYTCFAMNSLCCVQVKSQLDWLLGRSWVKSSTCRSAPLMSEWPRALERLSTFSAQRQEMTQISSTFPANNMFTPHVHSSDSILCLLRQFIFFFPPHVRLRR